MIASEPSALEAFAVLGAVVVGGAIVVAGTVACEAVAGWWRRRQRR